MYNREGGGGGKGKNCSALKKESASGVLSFIFAADEQNPSPTATLGRPPPTPSFISVTKAMPAMKQGRVKGGLLLIRLGFDLRRVGGRVTELGSSRRGGRGAGRRRANFATLTPIIPLDASSPVRSRFRVGDMVSVVPPTTAAGRDQEPFLGKVTEEESCGNVTVKTFESRARGRSVPAAWVFLNNTFITPASGERTRLSNLPSVSVERLKARAAIKCKVDADRLEKECEKLRQANCRLQEHHKGVVKKLIVKMDRRHEARLAVASMDHVKFKEEANAALDNRDKHIERLKRSVRFLEAEMGYLGEKLEAARWEVSSTTALLKGEVKVRQNAVTNARRDRKRLQVARDLSRKHFNEEMRKLLDGAMMSSERWRKSQGEVQCLPTSPVIAAVLLIIILKDSSGGCCPREEKGRLSPTFYPPSTSTT